MRMPSGSPYTGLGLKQGALAACLGTVGTPLNVQFNAGDAQHTTHTTLCQVHR